MFFQTATMEGTRKGTTSSSSRWKLCWTYHDVIVIGCSPSVISVNDLSQCSPMRFSNLFQSLISWRTPRLNVGSKKAQSGTAHESCSCVASLESFDTMRTMPQNATECHRLSHCSLWVTFALTCSRMLWDLTRNSCMIIQKFKIQAITVLHHSVSNVFKLSKGWHCLCALLNFISVLAALADRISQVPLTCWSKNIEIPSLQEVTQTNTH